MSDKRAQHQSNMKYPRMKDSFKYVRSIKKKVQET